MNEAEGRYYSAPYRKEKDMEIMMEIDTKKEAGALVGYLLNTAVGHLHYNDYLDIDGVTYLLGAAKTIARMYGLKEYDEISCRADGIKEEVREATERSLTTLNWV